MLERLISTKLPCNTYLIALCSIFLFWIFLHRAKAFPVEVNGELALILGRRLVTYQGCCDDPFPSLLSPVALEALASSTSPNTPS